MLCLCVQLAIAKNNIIKLQEENQQLRSENSLILLKAQQQLEVNSHPHKQKFEEKKETLLFGNTKWVSSYVKRDVADMYLWLMSFI